MCVFKCTKIFSNRDVRVFSEVHVWGSITVPHRGGGSITVPHRGGGGSITVPHRTSLGRSA